MESHEVLRQVFEQASPKQIAAELGLSLSLVYKWAEPNQESGSGAANPLDRVAALIEATKNPAIIQWLCERAGGFYIKNPDCNWKHAGALVPATNSILQEFADLLAVIATAASDNKISGSEAENIRARWEELKSVTECFVHCCEDGNFSPI
jgi:hypothetical protein